MKVVILGAGQVGRTVAQSLHPYPHMDLTVVDVDATALTDLRNHYSCTIVTGHASSPEVLEKAGIEDCDALIAVTGSDEVNLVACQVALSLHDTPNRIARIRNLAYLKQENTKFGLIDGFAVNNPISPELTVVDQLKNLISFRGAIRVMDFVHGSLVVTCIRVLPTSSLIGTLPLDFSATSNNQGYISAVLRGGVLMPEFESSPIQADDVVFITGDREAIRVLSQSASGILRPYKNIVIGGGGNIGLRLAEVAHDLSPTPNIKLIESDPVRSQHLADHLDIGGNLTILTGDVANEAFLSANDVNDSDLYCAVTNNDLVNVVSSQMAKRLNVSTVFTLVQHVDYLVPLSESGIEIPLSPQQTTANLIHALVTEKTLSTFHRLPYLGVDVIEITIRGDLDVSKVAGLNVKELESKLPGKSHLLAIARENDSGRVSLLSSSGESPDPIEDGDHAIILVEDRAVVKRIEALFRPKAISLF